MNILKEFPFVKEIEEDGFVYLVGGYVRDSLLGRQSKDIDLLVTLMPIEDLITILEKYGKVDQVGQSFGVLKMRYKEYDLDIAIPRTEIKTGVGHTGFKISSHYGLDIEEDLKRRDFTMNAIAIDSRGRYIDPSGGIKDIINKTIRAVSLKTFSDDPLRILRTFQFSARFGFPIDLDTKKIILNNVSDLSQISGERVHIELEKLFKGFNTRKVINEMFSLGIWTILLNVINIKVNDRFWSNTVCIKSIPQLFYSLSGQNLTDEDISALVSKYSLTNDEKRELNCLRSLKEDMSKENIYYLSKRWEKIYELDQYYPDQILEDNLDDFNYYAYPKNQSEIKILSSEIIDMGYVGTKVGKAWKLIVKAIMEDKIKNKKEEIIAYLKNNL